MSNSQHFLILENIKLSLSKELQEHENLDFQISVLKSILVNHGMLSVQLYAADDLVQMITCYMSHATYDILHM